MNTIVIMRAEARRRGGPELLPGAKRPFIMTRRTKRLRRARETRTAPPRLRASARMK
jgi:hypothetical protein